MSEKQPPPPESDADAVLSALKNMGSSDYATLAIATGLSKIAISAAITDLTKRGLVTGKSGTYSPTDAAASTPIGSRRPVRPGNRRPLRHPHRQRRARRRLKAPRSHSQPPTRTPTCAVLAALKKMGSGNYATLAEATGLSKMAVSSAITDLTKRDLVTGQSGEYSATDGVAKKKPAATKPATTKPKPAPAARKPKPSAKPAATDSDDDADVVLAALRNMGSGNYATLADATGLSKMAVSSAITDLTKRGLVAGQAGEYSPTDGTAAKTPAKPKTAPPAKKPKPSSPPGQAAAPGSSLAEELERLTALRDSGALTATEFTKAKKKLLDAS